MIKVRPPQWAPMSYYVIREFVEGTEPAQYIYWRMIAKNDALPCYQGKHERTRFETYREAVMAYAACKFMYGSRIVKVIQR